MKRKLATGFALGSFVFFFFLPIRLVQSGTISPSEHLWGSEEIRLQRISRNRFIQKYGLPDKCTETEEGHVKFDYCLDFNNTQWLRRIGLRTVDRSSFVTFEFNGGGYAESVAYTSTFNTGWFQ